MNEKISYVAYSKIFLIFHFQ